MGAKEEGVERERLWASRVRVRLGVLGLPQRITTEATNGEEE